MPRSIWKGSISFGLVTIPVALYTAENRKNLSFRMLDRRNMSRIQQRRFNAGTGEEVPFEEIVKGYEYEDGGYVILTDEELKAARPEASQTVSITAVVKSSEIPLAYFETPYYLEPLKQGRKAYALLREVFRRTGYVGLGRVVIRTREYIAAVIAQGPLLLLELMRYPEELRDPGELELPGEDLKTLGIDKRELEMAQRLVDAMAAPFNPEEYQDTYQDAVLKLVEEKAKTGTIGRPAAPAEAEPGPQTVDIMSLLKRSLENVEKRAEASKKKKGGKKQAESESKPERARKRA
ncbi:MAG: Ku protein [Acidobacteria bacterium]|nr:MAG: Ku protein [Acidobacteriota bacterium]